MTRQDKNLHAYTRETRNLSSDMAVWDLFFIQNILFKGLYHYSGRYFASCKIFQILQQRISPKKLFGKKKQPLEMKR